MDLIEYFKAPLYERSDLELAEAWNAVAANPSVIASDQVDRLIEEIRWRPLLSFSVADMSAAALNLVRDHLGRVVNSGVYFSPPHGKLIFDGEKSAVIKVKEYHRMTEFHILVSGAQSFGYVRFTAPVVLSKEDALARFDEHRISEAEMTKWWPDKTHFYLYSIRDFIPFDKPVQIEGGLEGSQVFIEVVKHVNPEAATAQPFELQFALCKALDEEEQIVAGVALVPDVFDLQGDVVTAEEIRKAAHHWMLNYQTLQTDHVRKSVDIRVIESYIAPADLTLGEQTITAGSWVLVSKIFDPEIWERVKKGELNGYSIGGWSKHIPLEEGAATA